MRRVWSAGVSPALLLLLTTAHAATLTYEGVLGNSGEAGDGLVRCGYGTAAKAAAGVGVVCDPQGTLWTRGGPGVLNRYSTDGRLLAQFKLPERTGGWNDNDLLTLVGRLLVLKQGERVYTLPLDAAPGSSATALKLAATRISYGSRDGWLAAANRKELFLLNPATGETRPLLTLPGDATWLEMGADGAVYPVVDWKLRQVVDGKLVEGWAKQPPGERPQLLDGDWFGHAWHGTIRRFDVGLEPAPGVVLGGASGSFIGHLDQNCEVMNGRGLAKLRDGLFAVSGMNAIVHLLHWSPQRRQFDVVRRLGCVPSCRGLGLDRRGNVWWYAGSWQWTDAPDAPLRYQVNAPDGEGVGQICMTDDDRMVTVGWMWGKPAFYHGALTGEIRGDRLENGVALAKEPVGCALFKDTLLVVDAAGRGHAYRSNGEFRGDLGEVELKLTSPGKVWTSLAVKDAGTLLAAVDGQVVELRREGAGWLESRRWPTRFGTAIWLTADSGRLWVSDTQHNRVVVLPLAGGEPVAEYATDLDGPTVVAARGERAVVYDSGQQRLVKLRLGS